MTGNDPVAPYEDLQGLSFAVTMNHLSSIPLSHINSPRTTIFTLNPKILPDYRRIWFKVYDKPTIENRD